VDWTLLAQFRQHSEMDSVIEVAISGWWQYSAIASGEVKNNGEEGV
jgi:hypothetical protein